MEVHQTPYLKGYPVPFAGPFRYLREAAEHQGIADPSVIDPAAKLLAGLGTLIAQVHDRKPADRATTLPYIERHLRILEVALDAGRAIVAEHVPELHPTAARPKKAPASKPE